MSTDQDDRDAERYTAIVAEIDELIERYDPGELSPERIVGDIIDERVAQRPLARAGRREGDDRVGVVSYDDRKDEATAIWQ